MFPKPECLTWLTIYFTLSFFTAALNAITIAVFRKHRNLRNRSAYLIINLAVADMLVGGFSTFDLSYFYGQICNIWKSDSGIIFHLRIAIALLFLVCSLANVTAISLDEVQMFVHLSPLPVLSIVDVSTPSCKSTLTGAGEAVSVPTNLSWSLGKTRPTLPLTQKSSKYATPQETVHK